MALGIVGRSVAVAWIAVGGLAHADPAPSPSDVLPVAGPGWDAALEAVRDQLRDSHHYAAIDAALRLARLAERAGDSLKVADALDVLVLARTDAQEGLLRSTLESAERALRIREQAPGDSLGLASTLASYGWALGAPRPERARPLLERSLAIRRAALPPGAPDLLSALSNLAAVERSDHPDRARNYLEEAVWGWGAGADTTRVHRSALRSRADLLDQARDSTRARAAWQRLRTLCERALAAHPGDESVFSAFETAELRLRAPARAESLARVHLAICERVLGPDHPDLTLPMSTLANRIRDSRPDAEEARALLRRAVEIRARAFGGSSRTARALADLARVEQAVGRVDSARVHYRASIEAFDRDAELDSVGLVRSLGWLVYIQDGQQRFADNLPLCRRVLAIRERMLGPAHADVGWAWNSLGWNLRGSGVRHESRAHFERAVAVLEKARGRGHADLVIPLLNLGQDVSDAGDFAAARTQLERALDIAERRSPRDDAQVAQCLFNLGILRRDSGDMAGARSLLERSLTLRERKLGTVHADLTITLNRLATFCARMGDHEAAARVSRRAVEVAQATKGPRSIEMSIALFALAYASLARNDYAAAESLFLKQLELQRSIEGVDHINQLPTLGNLAAIRVDLGDSTGARAAHERVLQLAARSWGPDHWQTGAPLLNLAHVAYARGDTAAALSLTKRAVDVTLAGLGPDHPVTGERLENQAGFLARLNRRTEALEALLRSEAIGRKQLSEAVRGLSERQALAYALVRRSGLDLGLSLAAGGLDSRSASQVWNVLIQARSLVLDEIASRHRRVHDLNRRASELGAAKEQVAALMVAAAGGDDASRRQAIEAARERQERAERALAEAGERRPLESDRGRVDVERLSLALAPSTAMVAYARYERDSLPSPSGEPFGRIPLRAESRTPSYLAFVLVGGRSDPEVIDLGRAAEIDSLVTAWRLEISRGSHVPERFLRESSYRATGEALRRRVWDPVARRTEGSGTVLLVPDGALQLVSFGTLPVGDHDYLVETGPRLHVLPTERDVVRQWEDAAPNHGLLALGGVDFDATGTPGHGSQKAAPPVDGAAQFRGDLSHCGDFGTMRWPSLPGTLAECRALSGLWKGTPGAIVDTLLLLTGPAASESRFKRLAPGRRILHLATHGFFVNGRCEAPAGRGESTGDLPQPAGGENPLVLSGLVLAGANQRDRVLPGAEDGVLTAEEVSALDLSGVDWAVLSACETGVGEVRAGEGVFGLRRAFQVAGVRTTIMSLWSVDDQATREWMHALYRRRLEARASTLDAVREADLEILRERRTSKRSTHPFYWGAFVAAGDWH